MELIFVVFAVYRVVKLQQQPRPSLFLFILYQKCVSNVLCQQNVQRNGFLCRFKWSTETLNKARFVLCNPKVKVLTFLGFIAHKKLSKFTGTKLYATQVWYVNVILSSVLLNIILISGVLWGSLQPAIIPIFIEWIQN